MKSSKNADSRNSYKIVCIAALLLLFATAAWAEEKGGKNWMGIPDILQLPRVWVGAIFCLIGLVLLAKSKVRRNLRLACLFVIFFAFAVFAFLPLGSFAMGMGLHPSPLCSITKPFLFMERGMSPPIIFWVILGTIALYTLVGNKLFCGWVCPIGAAQEIFNRVPLPGRGKVTLPFKATNPIRIIIFIAFFPLLFVLGINTYDYFNPFEFIHWGFQTMTIVVFAVTMIAAIFVFRPFCYLICPIGLFTWVLEHLSLAKVKVDNERCTSCGICVDESHCPAVRAILDERWSRPDCHACGRCMELCPEDALKFRN
ncbi:MAG: 4Fe-4S binding protein [Candidatus Latescibacterota bacterium]